MERSDSLTEQSQNAFLPGITQGPNLPGSGYFSSGLNMLALAPARVANEIERIINDPSGNYWSY